MGCLVRDDLFNATSLFHTNVHARFKWICISPISQHQRDIFIIIFYILPSSSLYTIHNVENVGPFLDLYEYISKFAAMGDIILLGDFDAQTKYL